MVIEIYCKENLDLNGKIYYREAVRGIVIENSKILLIHSKINGDYKLPGGGIEEGETPKEALIREVQEEAGVIVKVEEEVLRVMEYDEGQFDDCDIFKMLSIYYKCKSIKETEQNLDSYELEIGFTPEWVDINKAILSNKKVMESGKFPRWTKRETQVLEFIKINYL